MRSLNRSRGRPRRSFHQATRRLSGLLASERKVGKPNRAPDGTGPAGPTEKDAGESAPMPTPGQFLVEVHVRNTQEVVADKYTRALTQQASALSRAARRASDARRVAGRLIADPVARTAQVLHRDQVLAALRTYQSRHEPTAWVGLLFLLQVLAFLGDTGFALAILSGDISRSLPWYDTSRLMALSMALAISSVSVALADHTGRQLRPVWSGPDRGNALLRASVPLALTIIASIATYHLVSFRFSPDGALSFAPTTGLPARSIASLIVLLLWVILILEAHRPSTTPAADPRLNRIVQPWEQAVAAADDEASAADEAHRQAWLNLADAVDSAHVDIQMVFSTGAIIVLEDQARHGDEAPRRLAADPAVIGLAVTPDPAKALDRNPPAAFSVPPVLADSSLIARQYHHIARAITILDTYRPAGMTGTQERVRGLLTDLHEVAELYAQRFGVQPETGAVDRTDEAGLPKLTNADENAQVTRPLLIDVDATDDMGLNGASRPFRFGSDPLPAPESDRDGDR
jgi:hypothetical protein